MSNSCGFYRLVIIFNVRKTSLCCMVLNQVRLKVNQYDRGATKTFNYAEMFYKSFVEELLLIYLSGFAIVLVSIWGILDE